MKRIVVYKSKTGFTEKYAKWIAEELGCEAVAFEKIDLATLREYEQVIYGGWIMASMVSGYDKIKPLQLKNVIVFGSGMSVPNEKMIETMATQNDIPVDKFFYYEGGFAPKRVGFMGRMMIKMIVANLKKKEEKTADDLHMIETANGKDNTNREAIRKLIETAKKEGTE